MTFALVLLCFICFLIAPSGWALAPTHPDGAELVTHLLVHQSWEHLGSNLLVLGPFGWWYERQRGAVELLLLLLCAGVLSGAVEAAADPGYPGTILGCSGAASALLGAFGRLERWGFAVVVPVLGWYSYSALHPSGPDAHYAHLTGFAVGLFWASMWSEKSATPDCIPTT